MILNPAEVLNPVFNALDALIQDYGVFLYLVFVWLSLGAIAWVLGGGLRRKRPQGNSVTVVPGIIFTTRPPMHTSPPIVITEPKPTRRVEDEEIVEFLISEGLRISAAEELTTTFRRIRRLANYYYNGPAKWEDIREHETRTFLIVPLLIALGWPEQSIKIEQPVTGGRVDLALFDGPFAGDPNESVALIETKGFAQGLSYAPEQARNYAQHFPKCQVIFVSNGYCYKAYRRTKDGFSSEPSAYLNIRDPRDAYPLNPKIPGALEVLRLLLKGT